MEKIRAILFDCNGVIADDEPIHMELFQKVLREEGVPLTKKDYFQKYLAMDDRTCFKEALKSHGKNYSALKIKELVQRKSVYYKERVKTRLRIFPGVSSFVENHKKNYTMAVVSGALRHEIEMILDAAKIAEAFSLIISSEDTKSGKPDPEGYLAALNKLNQLPLFKKQPLQSQECLAIEDSIHGVEAVHRAGMLCLAITNSYSHEKLNSAEWVVPSLVGVRIEKLHLGYHSLRKQGIQQRGKLD